VLAGGPFSRLVPQKGQTDSTCGFTQVDGEVGQTSLERTDAKTASPSSIVDDHSPSGTQLIADDAGPVGPKEKVNGNLVSTPPFTGSATTA
jgi:hypothetical protein